MTKDKKKIYEAVCSVCFCTSEEVRSGSRKRLHVIARKIIAYLLAELTESDVGKLICRDHATVYYYRKMQSDDLAGDKLLKTKLYDTEKYLHKITKAR
jgi:chromosomal replication initiation ATPase DnaA